MAPQGTQCHNENRLHPGFCCAFCNAVTGKKYISNVRDRLGISPHVWSFVRCTACGSAILDPLPALEDIPGFYPEQYSVGMLSSATVIQRLVKGCADVLRYCIRARQVKWVLRMTRLPLGSQMLDVGCGNGAHLQMLHRHGMTVTGIDFNASSIDFIQKQLKMTALVGDVDTCLAKFGPGSFDLITAFHVMEHVVSPFEFASGCEKLLRPGGWLCGAIPTTDGTVARLLLEKWLVYTEAPRHICIPSTLGIRRLFSRAGLTLHAVVHESIVNIAGVLALSLLPSAATSNRCAFFSTQLLGGLLWLSFLPLAALTETLGRPSTVLFAARKN